MTREQIGARLALLLGNAALGEPPESLRAGAIDLCRTALSALGRAEEAEAEAARLRERIATLESHLSDAHHHLAEAHQDNDALQEKLARAHAALDDANKDAPDATAP